MAIMMPWMLCLVQVMFTLIIWAVVAPNLVGLRWLVSAPVFDEQWEAILVTENKQDPEGEPPATVRRDFFLR